MMRKQIFLTRFFLLSLFIGGHSYAAEPASASQMACPVTTEGRFQPRTDKIRTMPGNQSLSTGIVWLEQERYAAAYTALEDAINQGIPDQIERAHAYMQMGLIMCRLNSVESCQRNLEKAFMANGLFDLPISSRQLPNVQNSYALARQYFESRCLTAVPRIETTANMTGMSSFGESTLVLNVKPWAIVEVDGAAALTPPTTRLMLRPGRRVISIKHPKFGTALIEGDFKAGEVWILQKMF